MGEVIEVFGDLCEFGRIIGSQFGQFGQVGEFRLKLFEIRDHFLMRRQSPHNALRGFLIIPESGLDALLFEFGYLLTAPVKVKDTSQFWRSASVIRRVVL